MQSLQQPQIDLSQAETYVCENCGHDHFVTHYLIKKFSALLSPTGNEMIVPISCFACAKCDHINNDFLPENNQLM